MTSQNLRPYGEGASCQIPVNDPMRNIPMIRETVSQIVQRYGTHSEPIIREFALLIMRSTPDPMARLLPKISSFAGQPAFSHAGLEMEKRAELFADLLRTQNVGAVHLSHGEDFSRTLSMIVRESMMEIKGVPMPTAQQPPIASIIRKETAVEEKVMRLQPGDRRSVEDLTKRPWVFDMCKPRVETRA